MDRIQLKKLKDDFNQFLNLYNELKRAKNQRERSRIDNELDTLKNRMIHDFELRQHDNYVTHYSDDNHWFKCDVESIIDNLEKDNFNS